MSKDYSGVIKSPWSLLAFLLLLSGFHSCSTRKSLSGADQKGGKMIKTDSFLVNLLAANPQYFSNILEQRAQLRVQIIYTQINRTKTNEPVFTNYYFNVNPHQYFYPASMVKMPVALLTLQRLRELGKDGMDTKTTMVTGKATDIQSAVYNDPESMDGRPTVEQYIKKIFLVSDNDAFNRLYEFLGPEYINRKLRDMGYAHAEIIHRLSISLTEKQNRQTNPVRFLDAKLNLLHEEPFKESNLPFLLRKDHLGKGYMKDGKLVFKPFDFSRKNKLLLEDLHSILQSIMFPAAVPETKRFDLNDSDYRLVWKYMSQYPSETNWPVYDADHYWDAYCKFLFWGSGKETLPRDMRIFNKVGEAYGFLTDAAYIVDFTRHIEFMLSASIYCNSDELFNDDKYDYDTIGFPFMKNLGRVIYEYESARVKNIEPDLSAFKMVYDKH